MITLTSRLKLLLLLWTLTIQFFINMTQGKLAKTGSDIIINKLRNDIDEWIFGIKTYYQNNKDIIFKMVKSSTMSTFDDDDKHIETNKFDNVDTLPTLRKKQYVVHDLMQDEHNLESQNHNFNRRELVESINCLTGVMVNITNIIYKCQDILFDEKRYQIYIKEPKNQNSTCQKIVNIRPACYCPYEFFGTYCNLQQYIYCDVNIISPFQKCSNATTDAYNFNVQGDPPCNRVTFSDIVDFKFAYDCSNYDSSSYEGVKGRYPSSFNTTIPGLIALDYKTNTPHLKLNFDEQFALKINFVDWNKISNSKSFEFNLAVDQLAGGTSEHKINISSIRNSSVSGRYYFELELLWNKTYQIQSTIKYGYLEDSSFTLRVNPPTTSIKMPTFIIIMMALIVSVMTIGAIAYMIIDYYKNKYNKVSYYRINQERDASIIVSSSVSDCQR